MKKSNQFCWKKDSCQMKKCKFIHPRDSVKPQSQQNSNISIHRCNFDPSRINASSELPHSSNSQSNSYQRQSVESSSTSYHLQNSKWPAKKDTNRNIVHQANVSKQDTQLESLSHLEEDTIEQHRNIVSNIKDEISKIQLSDDYSINYEKQQANIRILQGNIIELESHILIFDSVKSRAYRELSTKPHELYVQILREIYRLKCRLGAFGKRLDIEKHLTSGHRFLIIQGQTGSGKSTQIPQYLADHPRFYGKKIVCTQPRKLAAISLARRVSFEYTGKIVNNDNDFSYVGYQVGGDQRKGKDCRIEFVTEGIMLERIMKGDVNTFRSVGCIIIDEAHERSIICDLLLGSFKKLDPRWNDILVIVTSATIDLNLFSEYFNDAPTVQIEGRTFPVDIIYQPITNESEIQFAVAQCAFEIHQNCKSLPGDILCFLPGLEDLLNATSIFERKLKMVNRNSGLLDAKVFTLYGKQDPEQQAKVFESFDTTTTRKIIFATDVAETSITIDGVVYVVDSGVKKEIVFDPQRNISSLKINNISKSSAIQRAGRSGRTQPGICYRLYSQDEFESMNINAAPEVLCKPISLAVLTLLEMSTDPIEFDWISSPSKEAMANAEKELTILGAVDSNRKLTALGNLIATCQQDPKMMKIVHCGCLKGFGEAACTVAAILTVSSMFFWNGNDAESKAKAMNQRKKVALAEGDIVTMYRIFEDWNSIYHGRKPSNPEKPDKSENSSVSNSKKMASVWCRDNCINGKSMIMALSTRAELLKQLRKTKVWHSVKSQNKLPTNLDVQEVMCSGYFTQSARVFYSKNIQTSIEYFSVESEVAGRLDFRSTLRLLDIEAPKWIVYDKIVRLPNTIFPIASVMDDAWLKETNPDFYTVCLKKTESLPTDLIVKSISQVTFRMIVGKNFCNVDSLEKELGCLVTGDAETGQLYLYCAPIKKDNIEQLITSKIEAVLNEIKKQVSEEKYIGETRVVIGEGYKVHDILFENEFATLYIKNIPMDICKTTLKEILTTGNEDLASLDCVEQDKKYTAVAKFSSKKDAKVSYERLLQVFVLETQITVSPSFGESKGIRHGLTCRLKLTWPTAKSKGIANIFFNTPAGANDFLENVHYIYPSATIHVCGETLRSAQRKMYENRPNIVQPPLTYLKLGKYDRRCRFRFDLDAIESMPDKRKLNYKVKMTGLQPSVDKHKLTTTLNDYGLKNVIVEYEQFKPPPDCGNGLTIEEKTVKLSPLSRFIKTDTRTSDFFYKNSGVAGICVFFTSNSTAKEAYNYAKPKYDSFDLQPHHLEIEFTHMISIQIGLFTFLKPQITEVQKEAHQKGISAVTTPLRTNSKFVIMRFHTSKHSLLTWIQEKLDELTRATKFNCPNSEVLFTWTGRQQLMKLGKKAYIHWNDDSHVIWVYGSLEHKEQTCKEIETKAAYLKSLDILDQEIWLNKTVKINGKEGKNISTKCREEKLAFYHFHGNKFFISGSKNSVDAVVQYLENNRYNWNRSKNRFKYEESRECGLCGMPPDDTFIMLSVCEHLFCSDCIEPMINMQPPPFPVTCPVCQQFVALHDIKKLGPTKSLEKVVELAVRKFQEEHSYDIRLCPNPGCSQLLSYLQRTTGTYGGDFLFCDECISTFCISCSDKMSKPIKSHENDSCDDVQNGVSHLVYKHVRTIQETVLNLSCPKCKTAFFDFSNCAAVTCDNCKAGFCGLCLAHCGNDAHSHVPSCSKNTKGSVFVNIEDINAANLEIRNEKLREYMQRNVSDSKLRNSVIRSIQKDLVDLGMDVPNILAVSEDLDGSTEVSLAIVRHVRKIQETILTLGCPNCEAAFFDFDGCAAVTCDSCRTEFCGLCLRFCGTNVLGHVSTCTRNPNQGNYFVSSNELPKIHAAVRSENLAAYFQCHIEDTKAKEAVLSIIRRDLTDLNIELPRIAARPVVRQPSYIPVFAYRLPAAEPMRAQPFPAYGIRRISPVRPIPAYDNRRVSPVRPIPAYGNRRISPVRPVRQQVKRDCCIL